MQILVFISLSIIAFTKQYDLELIHSFKWLNFSFNIMEEYDNYLLYKNYKNCLFTRSNKKKFKWWDLRFCSLMEKNVPATLSKIIHLDNKTLLSPFPSWEGNNIGNASALQSVLGFEIDLEDNIWVLD